MGHVKSGWASGWICSRRRRSSRGAVMNWRCGGRRCRGSALTRNIDSTPTKGAPRWQNFFEVVHNSSSTISCSGPTTPPVAHPVP